MAGPAEWRVAVVIPAYQAAATVGATVARTLRALPDARVIVVDDGSSDDTGAAARAAGSAVVLRHPENRGKGAAISTGIAAGLADGATALVTLDADGQHDPAAIPGLLEPVLSGQADLVLGARARTTRMPPQRRLSNWLSSRLASRIGGEGAGGGKQGNRVPDAQTGFRAFTHRLATSIRPPETRYDYELAFLLGALAGGWRVRSILVPTIYDAGVVSHFRPLADTWRVARVFARYGGKILMGAS